MAAGVSFLLMAAIRSRSRRCCLTFRWYQPQKANRGRRIIVRSIQIGRFLREEVVRLVLVIGFSLWPGAGRRAFIFARSSVPSLSSVPFSGDEEGLCPRFHRHSPMLSSDIYQ